MGKARGGKDSPKVGSDLSLCPRSLILGMPLPWGLALHTWKKKKKEKKKSASSKIQKFANFQP